MIPVSVIIPMRNAATTVLETLRTITMQKYPIAEVIVVDNVSKDNCRDIVLANARKSKIPITLIKRQKDLGVASSYNLGTRRAKSELVVFLTSDASLSTDRELEKLTKPLREDASVVASYPSTLLPGWLWEKYNFWQKFHSSRDVDIDNSTLALKFDCIRRKTFLEIGGFDEVNFGGDSAIGGEDVDLTMRLREKGKIAKSQATAYHLHYMGSDYSLRNMMRSRKMSARSYGRFLRKSAFKDIRTTIEFSIRPALAILPLIPSFNNVGILLLLFYSLYYTHKMFIAPSTRSDLRIVLIPILNIFFLYHDLFWLLEAFFTYRENRANQGKNRYNI